MPSSSVSWTAIQLRSRAAIGLEEEVVGGFSRAHRCRAWRAPEQGPRHVDSPKGNAACRSECMRRKGLAHLYHLPLVDADQLMGVVCFALHEERDFSHTDQQLLDALASRASAAVRHHLALTSRTGHPFLGMTFFGRGARSAKPHQRDFDRRQHVAAARPRFFRATPPPAHHARRATRGSTGP